MSHATLVAAGAVVCAFISQAAPAVRAQTAAPTASPSAAAAAPASPSAAAASPQPGALPAPIASPAPLSLAKTRLQLAPKATTEIALGGGVPPYVITPSAPIVEIRFDAARGALVLRAVAAGSATLTVSDAAGTTVTATVLVAPNAGFVPSVLALTLLGSPNAEFIAAQVRAALQRAAHPLPGARVALPDAHYPADMAPGERLDVPVRVHLDGAGRYVDVDGITNVHIATRAAPAIVPQTLFYSDDPEKVRSDGVLFRGTLSVTNPIRLYYYHQAAGAGHRIAILLDAPAGTAQVRVVGEGAGPNPAVMFVGQSATFRYLDLERRGAGVGLDVPVGAPVELFAGDGALGPADLVAGVLDVAVTAGDPVRLTVVSRAEDDDVRSLLGADELVTDGKHRRGEYDLRSDPLALAYRIGDPDPAAVAVGQAGTALVNRRPGGRALGGDYGLLRPLALTVSNPTDAAASVYLYEQPIGFPVTTTVFFDGDPAPMRVQCVKDASQRYLVRAFGVAAGATETITGTYMTDGGSTYPLSFGLTSNVPSPAPVTMTAPNGCFPKKPA